MTQQLVILGTGSFAEQLAEVVQDIGDYSMIGFVENQDPQKCSSGLAGWPVYWIEDLPSLVNDAVAVCAFGSTRRRAFIERAERLALRFGKVLHPTAVIGRQTTVGLGSVVLAGANIAPLSEIGRHTLVNRGVLIGHHTCVGEIVTLSPGANIAGKCAIGDGTYVGMGAIVLDGVQIGRHCVIGAGAVVTRDVPDRVQVVGVPAKVVKRGVEGY